MLVESRLTYYVYCVTLTVVENQNSKKEIRMPFVTMRYKRSRVTSSFVDMLAHELPRIIAPHLSLGGRERNEGLVTPDDIMVQCEEGGPYDVNTKDIQISILAHDFPERVVNLESRKEAILEGIRAVMTHYGAKASGCVLITLHHMAYGKL